MPDVSPFHLDLTENEIEALQQTFGDILRSGQLILNKHTEQFEREFADMAGVQHAVAVSTGTSALQMLLMAHSADGKPVAVPTNTNFASVAAILAAGGHPVLLDMDPRTFAPSLQMLEESYQRDKIAGVVWVHIGGLISPEFGAVSEFCRTRKLFLIEDAAHAHGSMFNGTSAGAFGDGGAFSFFPTKVMTTMEGGMVTTHNSDIADLARSYRNQGKGAAKFGSDHLHLGSSWRLSELAAAIGVVQLRKLDSMIARRAKAADAMARTLDDIQVQYCPYQHMDRASQYKLIVRYSHGVPCDEIKARLRLAWCHCWWRRVRTPMPRSARIRRYHSAKGWISGCRRTVPKACVSTTHIRHDR